MVNKSPVNNCDISIKPGIELYSIEYIVIEEFE